MKLPKNPLWPIQPSWKFDGDPGGDPGGGGDPAPHWAGDADHQKWAKEEGFNDSASVVKAHRDLTGKHWAGEDKDLQAYVDKKGIKDAGAAMKVYRDMETKMGTMVGLPGEDATDEDWDKFASKLRPRNVAAYADAAPKGIPEDVYDEGMAAVMKQAAYDIGIPPKLFSSLWSRYWLAVGSQVKDLDDKAAEIKADDEKTMRVAWKKDYDANVELANRAMEKTGLKELFTSLGIASHPLVQTAFHHFSESLEEFKPPDGKGGKKTEEGGEWFAGDYSYLEK